MSARAFSRESVKPRSTTRTSKRCLPFIVGAELRFPADDEIGQFAQARTALAKRLQGAMRGEPLMFGHLARALESVNCWESNFFLLRVLARSLAERLGRLLDVEHVVDD